MKRYGIRVIGPVILFFVILSIVAPAVPGQTMAMPMDHSMMQQAAAEGSWVSRLLEVYVPRKMCMNYEADVIWTHLISDSIIAFSYFTIPIALIYFVHKRKDLAFDWMFFAFAVFILACGTTHIFNIIAIWHPYYRLDGVVKAITALASVVTAITLWPLIPKALAIPNVTALHTANSELQRVKDDLEVRVGDRTMDLQTANESLRKLIAERDQLLASERVARADAENANRLKDEFVATLSHELRTPVNAVLGWTRVLRLPSATAGDLAEGLEIIDRNTRVQVQLIEDLLDMSRILSGKMRLDMRKVELPEIIDASIETVRPAVDAKEIQIHKTIDPLAAAVMGDPNRLQQIVWNLLSNAVKFTLRGGRIEVELLRVNSHVEIVVSDSGVGITPDFLPHVFERFRQADSSSTRRYGGLGLGLAIVRNLVELHGGSVTVRSAGEGKGARFCVMLPVPAIHDGRQSGENLHVVGETAGDETPSLAGLKVLVVDDETDARLLVKRLLEEFGAVVTVAGSAEAGYAAIRKERPAVIVSDIGMPEVDGYAFIKAVRAWPEAEGGAIPAIALTAFARAEDRRRALLAGFQMHIAKPVEAPDLIAVIASVAGLMGRKGPGA